jgi:hypothetical protein
MGLGVVNRALVGVAILLSAALLMDLRASPAAAQAVFTHDAGTAGVAGPPVNEVFVLRDPAEIFASPVDSCGSDGTNVGNDLFADVPAARKS